MVLSGENEEDFHLENSKHPINNLGDGGEESSSENEEIFDSNRRKLLNLIVEIVVKATLKEHNEKSD